MPRALLACAFVFSVALLLMGSAFAQDEYTRQAPAAPQVESIGGGYQLPPTQRVAARAMWLYGLDLVLLLVGLLVAALIVHRWRQPWMVTALAAISLAYFGFYRQGCVCPIGSIQNVVAGLTDSTVQVPLVVIAFFLFPLGAALVAGRVFCGGVCPLGAIQELVALRPRQIPAWVDNVFGRFRYVYLTLAMVFAMLPTASRDFVICRFDPFVPLFRMTGEAGIIALGLGLLALGVFVARPYCRFVCPYGALLGIVARVAHWRVSITPDHELDCGLCSEACPYGAIRDLRAVSSRCVACARCFAHCPRQRLAWGEIELHEIEPLIERSKKAIRREACP
jgi:NosR/NirI family transcriptional regulator, nitrous oxide reductase regulator